MKYRPRFTTVFLIIVLLVAAYIDYFVVFRHHRSALPEITPGQLAGQPSGPVVIPPAPGTSAAGGALPNYSKPAFIAPPAFYWGGDLSVKKAGDGYDFTIVARQGPSVIKLDSVEVTLDRPGQKDHAMTLAFRKDSKGVFSAHADIPALGVWKAHIQLHRGHETLTFTKMLSLGKI